MKKKTPKYSPKSKKYNQEYEPFEYSASLKQTIDESYTLLDSYNLKVTEEKYII